MKEKVNPIGVGIGIITYIISSVWALLPIVRLYYRYKGYMGGDLPETKDIWDMYKNPLLCYQALKEQKLFIGWIILLTVVTLITIVAIVILKNMDIEQVGTQYLKENGTMGTANWMDKKEIKKILGYGTNEGLIFGTYNGKILTLPKESYHNRHVAVFGASGSMKSRAYVRTNILQLSAEGHSIIATDPKGELFRDMAPMLRKKGYNVKIFNLVNMQHSDRWNPLSEVKDDIDAQTAADVIIANTQPHGKKAGGDPFWDRAEQNLLKALILYVVNEYTNDEDRNLPMAYQLLASGDPKKIQFTFESLKNDHPAKMPYNIYAQASETVRTGVVIGLGTRLQVFQNKLVQELTKVSDINLSLPGKEKCAYFCVISDTDTTFDFLAGLYFSFLFIKLIRYADYNGGRGEQEVYFLLDEFPNIAQIPDFTKKISTMRSRGIHSSVIFQNIAQLKNRYPMDAWQEIIGNCDSRLFLGCTDTMTAQFVCDLLGKSTVRDQSRTKEAGLEGIYDFGRITTKATQRNLLNPDEILRLPSENAILILRGQKPLMIEKMDYTKHKLAKHIKPEPISNYNPQWTQLLKRNTAEENQIAQPIRESKKESDLQAETETTVNVENKKPNNKKNKSNSEDVQAQQITIEERVYYIGNENEQKKIEKENDNSEREEPDIIIPKDDFWS